MKIYIAHGQFTCLLILQLIPLGLFYFITTYKKEYYFVKIDSATINDKIDVLNLNKYTDSHRYSGDYRYLFDEICIDVDKYIYIK